MRRRPNAPTLGDAVAIERRALAGVVILGLAPVAACGLWALLTLGSERGDGIPAAGALAAAVATALAGLLARIVARDRVWLAPAAVVAVSAVVIALRPEGGWPLSIVTLAVGIVAISAFGPLARRLPGAVDGWARRRPVLALLWLLAALLAGAQTHRMSVFMADPAATGYSMMPGLESVERHSCLSAYYQAAVLARAGHDNVYDFDAAPEEIRGDISPFFRDTYQYPPPFLLLPSLLVWASADFLLVRVFWFVLTVAIVALGWSCVAGWVGGRDRAWMIGLAPVFWISMPVQFNLQGGNFHLALVVTAVVAMVALARERLATGGALLAFAALAKISPAILGVELVARRRWRAVGWTVGWAVVWCLAVLPVLGASPWVAFFEHDLPALRSGRAFPFLERSLNEIANNFSPFGLPFKLRELGLDVGWPEARVAGEIYSVALLGIAVLAALRLGSAPPRGHRLRVWLALLTLAALRSPFATQMAFVGVAWLLVLLAEDCRKRWQVAGLVVLWPLLTVGAPMESVAPALVLSFVRQGLLFAGLIWLALRSPVASVPDPETA